MATPNRRLQAAALRLAAERLERGETLAPALVAGLKEEMDRHSDELAAVEAHDGALPQWMAEELDRRDREEAATGADDGEVVMARLLNKYARRRSA